MSNWKITLHAVEKEALLSHRSLPVQLSQIRKELAAFAEIAIPERYLPNGRVKMRAAGYQGRLIAIPAQKKIVTVTLLD